jgi:hypothetical protein
MLATLVHSTLVSDAQSEKGEENRKHYQNLMKKLKKVANNYVLYLTFYLMPLSLVLNTLISFL